MLPIASDLQRLQMGLDTWQSLIEAERAAEAAARQSADELLPTEARAFRWLVGMTGYIRHWRVVDWNELWPEESGVLATRCGRELAKLEFVGSGFREASAKLLSPVRLRQEGAEFEALRVSADWAREQFEFAVRAVSGALSALGEVRPTAVLPWPLRTLGLGAGWEQFETPVLGWLEDGFRVVASSGQEDCTASVELRESRWVLTVTHQRDGKELACDATENWAEVSCDVAIAALTADRLMREARPVRA